MCQSAAAFGAGLWVAQRLGEVALPAVRVAAPEGRPFKLRVRVHSASAAGLEAPGLLARQRPRVEVVVGGARKETELGDLQRSRPPGAAAASGPAAAGGRPAQPPAAWGFGETLTFSAGAADVLGAGVQLWLRAQSDVRLGPLQVSLSRPRDVGMCSVDLRRRVLPRCAARDSGGRACRRGDEFAGAWETPVLTFPLTYIGGGSSVGALGQAVGKVFVSFSVDSDPRALLRSLDDAERPMLRRMADPVREWMERPARWIAESGLAASCQIGLGGLCAAGACRELMGEASKGFLLDRSPSAASTASGCSSPSCSSPSEASLSSQEAPGDPRARGAGGGPGAHGLPALTRGGAGASAAVPAALPAAGARTAALPTRPAPCAQGRAGPRPAPSSSAGLAAPGRAGARWLPEPRALVR